MKRKQVCYICCIVVESIMLFFLMVRLWNEMVIVSPEHSFAEVFEVDCDTEFKVVFENLGEFQVDGYILYVSNIPKDKIVSKLAEWETWEPDYPNMDNKAKQYMGNIKKGFYKESDRDPLHLICMKNYVAVYDMDNEKMYFYDNHY